MLRIIYIIIDGAIQKINTHTQICVRCYIIYIYIFKENCWINREIILAYLNCKISWWCLCAGAILFIPIWFCASFGQWNTGLYKMVDGYISLAVGAYKTASHTLDWLSLNMISCHVGLTKLTTSKYKLKKVGTIIMISETVSFSMIQNI